jgi:hypothetical protein
MSTPFFIIGMRRSGTSILRNLIAKSPDIEEILFEPHEILHAVSLVKIKRYKTSQYHNNVIKNLKHNKGTHGVKLALNPGIDALDWIWLTKNFENAKFIFIIRNRESTYKSYHNADKKTARGVVSKEAYDPMYMEVVNSFEKFARKNKNSCIVKYEQLLKDADKELQKVWQLLGVKTPKNLNSMIRKPKF